MSAAPPFGALSPNAWQGALLSACHALQGAGPARAAITPARTLLLASLDGPLDVDVYGFSARLYPNDNLTDKRVLTTPRMFDAVERACLSAAIHDRFTFIDAGANTGMYSLFAASLAGPQSRIIAIEPQPDIKQRLAFNIAANGFDQITHVDAALAEGPGEAVLHIAASNRGESSITGDGTDGVRVPTLSLFDLMEQHGVVRADALKIDIEGAEDRVLPPFFETCPPERLPAMMIMETLSRDWSVDCVVLAKDAGYRTLRDTRRNLVLVRS